MAGSTRDIQIIVKKQARTPEDERAVAHTLLIELLS